MAMGETYAKPFEWSVIGDEGGSRAGSSGLEKLTACLTVSTALTATLASQRELTAPTHSGTHSPGTRSMPSASITPSSTAGIRASG